MPALEAIKVDSSTKNLNRYAWETNVPSLHLSVLCCGRLLLRRGFGQADQGEGGEAETAEWASEDAPQKVECGDAIAA